MTTSKTRVTLTVDDDFVALYKLAAEKRGLTTSEFAEKLLRSVIDEGRPSFVDRMRGMLDLEKLLERAKTDDRLRYLLTKYGYIESN